MKPAPQPQSRFPYNKGCIVLSMGLALTLWGAYLRGHAEVMGSFMFGLLIVWQVINGLILKRRYWHIPEEKTTFWALIIALSICICLLLSLAPEPATPATMPAL